ncbi:MAG TPA: hypothetical protein VEF04_02380 [Blastocatellia bacterium]|nr:hypothetical protein [Blastocatellia bacterium]
MTRTISSQFIAGSVSGIALQWHAQAKSRATNEFDWMNLCHYGSLSV